MAPREVVVTWALPAPDFDVKWSAMRYAYFRIAILPVAVSSVACGGSNPPEPNVAPTPPATQASAKETPQQAAQSGNIQISPDILKACGISEADALFPFDSARLEKQDIVPLNAVATCFASGPLKGHLMKLVGRADPRGSADYNITLGQSRADTVQKYVKGKGVPTEKIESTSRGAMDATGTNEAGWAHDRRVDIVLGS
jgi:peptidoglycan-associated lipoprotein